MDNDRRSYFIDDLREIGCEEPLIQALDEALKLQRYDKVLRLLSVCKCRLLRQLHRSQQRVDVIDFLLYQVRQEQKGGI